MKVKEVMTAEHSLECCGPETKLQTAAKTMKAANCGSLPVVDKTNKVLGIITDRDICLSLADHPAPEKTKIESIMSSKVYTVGIDEDLSVALRQMRVHQIGRVPVVDEKRKLKGIISLHNLIEKKVREGEGLGTISDSGENILKTLLAIGNRYNGSIKEKKGAYLEVEDLQEV